MGRVTLIRRIISDIYIDEDVKVVKVVFVGGVVVVEVSRGNKKTSKL